jgi:hypothetical protein
MAQTVEWHGGISLGGTGCISLGVWGPLATLDATGAGITFSMPPYPLLIPSRCFIEKSTIITVREYLGMQVYFSRGVQIVHTNKDSPPPFVVFWTWQPKKLLRQLQALGYPIGKRRVWWDTFTRPDESEG